MNHFGHDHDGVLRLKNLHVVVVLTRHERRAGIETDQATLRQSAIFRSVLASATDAKTNRTRAASIGAESAVLHSYPRLSRGHPSVRWIDDQRSTQVGSLSEAF